MKKPLLLSLLAALSGITATADAAAPARVSVLGDRILIADLLPGAPVEIGALDFGPAPQPGHSRWLSRGEIRRRLHQAMVHVPRLRIPRRIQVGRPAQRLSEPQLRRLVQQAVMARLPAGASLRHVGVVGGVVLPAGNITTEIDTPARWHPGRQVVRVRLQAGASAAIVVPATLTIEMASVDRTPLVRRGDRVIIAARAPGLEVRTRGVAQRDGASGETIAVLPLNGNRVLLARVRDANNVEIDL